MDAYRTWFGYLSAQAIGLCGDRLTKDCPGCQNGIISPLLHLHTHFNLLETMKKYMHLIALEMDFQLLYNNFILKFGYFNISEEEFIKSGESFIKFSTPDAIYYGNYITQEIDHALYSKTPAYEPNSPSYDPTPVKGSAKRMISETSAYITNSHNKEPAKKKRCVKRTDD